MPNQIENRTLMRLTTFKEYVLGDFTDECKKRCGARTFSVYMKPYIEDMLENFEAEIETVSERALLEDELSYDENYQGE